jgi:hypothetical protein
MMMRCYLLVCSVRWLQALQAPRPHRASSPLRASPPATDDRAPTAQWLTRLALAGAALGPVCDNFHSAAGVLGYTKHRVAFGVAPDWWGGGHLLQTAAWVPPLFALAALIIGGIDALVSAYKPPPPHLATPAGRRVGTVVAAFVLLYALSALLATSLAPAAEAVVLWPLALLLWRRCDPTLASFVAGASTAIGGPAIEAALLGGGGRFPEPFGHLYAYAHPDLLGVESWILPVYFAGGPAVALVSRWLRRGGAGYGVAQ